MGFVPSHFVLSGSLWRYSDVTEPKRKRKKENKMHLISWVSVKSQTSWLTMQVNRQNSHWLKGLGYEKAKGNTSNSALPRAHEGIVRNSQSSLSWEKHTIKIVSIASQYVFLQLKAHCSCSAHLSYTSVTFSPCQMSLNKVEKLCACIGGFHVIKTKNMIGKLFLIFLHSFS